jgi:LDH2 family malate/lactate/ureidoglycolate dehydrogenase
MAATAASLDPGRNLLPESGAVGRQGAFFWMVKPQAFGDAGFFGDYMASWTRTYLEAGAGKAKLPGSRGVRLEREGRAHGIEIGEPIAKELVALGARLDIPFNG